MPIPKSEPNRTKELAESARRSGFSVRGQDAAEAKIALKAMQAPDAGNDLGNSVVGAKWSGQKLNLNEDFLVRRYGAALVSDQELKAIKDAAAGVAAERKSVEFHSAPAHEQRTRDARLAYGSELTEANRETLRALESVDVTNLYVIQQHAHQRKIEIISGLADLEVSVYKKFADLLERDAETVAAGHLELYSQFTAGIPADPLALALCAHAKRYRDTIDHRARGYRAGEELPQLFEAILRVAAE